MAFDPTRLSVAVQTLGGRDFRILFYETADSQTTVFTAGYFTNVDKKGVQVGDSIACYSTSDQAHFGASVTAISASGTATITGDASQNAPYIVTGATHAATTAARFGHSKNLIDDFGGKGDSVVDDTAAIMDAVNSGQSFFIPQGTYNFADDLNVTVGGGQIIRGQGCFLSKFKSTASGVHGLVLKVPNVRVIDLGIQDVSNPGAAESFTFAAGYLGTGAHFIRCRGYNGDDSHFRVGRIADDSATVDSPEHGRDYVIEGCISDHNNEGAGFEFIGCEGAYAHGNVAVDHQGDRPPYRLASARNVQLIGNKARDWPTGIAACSVTPGSLMSSAYKNQLIGNHFVSVTANSYGIALSDDGKTFFDILVANNIVDIPVDATSSYAMEIVGTNAAAQNWYEIQIINNIFKGGARSVKAVSAYNSVLSLATISQNKFINYSIYGVDQQDVNSYLIITDNEFKEVGAVNRPLAQLQLDCATFLRNKASNSDTESNGPKYDGMLYEQLEISPRYFRGLASIENLGFIKAKMPRSINGSSDRAGKVRVQRPGRLDFLEGQFQARAGGAAIIVNGPSTVGGSDGTDKSALVDATTGALTGTTGTTLHVTVSAHTDEYVYLENQLGGTSRLVLEMS